MKINNVEHECMRFNERDLSDVKPANTCINCYNFYVTPTTICPILTDKEERYGVDYHEFSCRYFGIPLGGVR